MPSPVGELERGDSVTSFSEQANKKKRLFAATRVCMRERVRSAKDSAAEQRLQQPPLSESCVSLSFVLERLTFPSRRQRKSLRVFGEAKVDFVSTYQGGCLPTQEKNT